MFLAELPDAWDIPDKVHATVQGACHACLAGVWLLREMLQVNIFEVQRL